MSAKVKTTRIQGHPTIVIHGDIIGGDASRITLKVNDYFKKNAKVLVISLKKTHMIDSYGLGAFVYIWKQANEQNCKLIFHVEDTFDRNIFSSANLDKLFSIVTSLENL